MNIMVEGRALAARESAARRLAHREGYRLHKGRREADRGFWAITDPERGFAIYGIDAQGGYDATLGDVEAWLRD